MPLLCYAAIPRKKLYYAQPKFYYASNYTHEFYYNNNNNTFARKCMQKGHACQPSSGSVERGFSMLKQFNNQEQAALKDYIEGVLMIRYNVL